ncbi:Ribonuclease [Thalictrum thalictroides]|uniref:Ribonuclease n=1 Tax=Thalictrum thalictroides TaxID=46969 RepID=A0A7J6XB01_THATH|nr:Ribonuclease [Thalictrum thalictroides]
MISSKSTRLFFVVFFFSALSLLSLSNQNEDDDHKNNVSITAMRPNPITPGAFDHYILAIQWAPSVCQGSKSKCKMPYTAEFGIHGLWPNLIGVPENQQPAGCDPKNVLDYNQLNPIIKDLSDTWPDLMQKPATPPGKNEFWEKEWLKHGTCSGLSMFDYFNQTMVLFGGLHLQTSLGQMGYNPGTGAKYSISKIINSWATTYKASPRIICKTVMASPSLNEMRFNISKSFAVQSMVGDRSASCPPTTSLNDDISFPA